MTNPPSPRSLRKEEVERLVEELHDLIAGLHIGKIFDAALGNLRVVVGSGQRRRDLLVSLHPGTSRVVLWDEPPGAPSRPGELASKLRELISGTRIDKVDQPGGDRIMRFTLSCGGSPRIEREMIVELFGRQGRLLIIESRSRRVLLVVGRGGLGRGEPYKFPEPVASPDETVPAATLPFDPLQMIPESFRSGEAPLHRFLFETLDRAEKENLLHGKIRQQEQQLRRSRKLLRRRISQLKKDLESGQKWQQWQRQGELLKANLSKMSRGMKSIEVQDWYQDDAPMIELTLEEDRTPLQNIEKYFRRSRKGKRSLQILTERLDESESAVALMEEQLQKLSSLMLLEDLDEETVEAHCQSAAEVLKRHGKKRQVRKSPGDRRAATQQPKKFRVYRSREGLEILAGRSARENDDLSIRTARGNDLFFHMARRPGAHVILKVERGKTASPESIEDAAFVAAHLSGWRGPGAAVVHWTEAKYVRKPKGFPPGKVLIEREREFLVSTREGGLSTLTVEDSD